jgi:hypothetical protein
MTLSRRRPALAPRSDRDDAAALALREALERAESKRRGVHQDVV